MDLVGSPAQGKLDLYRPAVNTTETSDPSALHLGPKLEPIDNRVQAGTKIAPKMASVEAHSLELDVRSVKLSAPLDTDDTADLADVLKKDFLKSWGSLKVLRRAEHTDV
jgi:hypothetical protein